MLFLIHSNNLLSAKHIHSAKKTSFFLRKTFLWKHFTIYEAQIRTCPDYCGFFCHAVSPKALSILTASKGGHPSGPQRFLKSG